MTDFEYPSDMVPHPRFGREASPRVLMCLGI